MSPVPDFICLAGASGAGKDTLGAMLTELHGYQRVALADPLKQAMMNLFGLSHEQLWGEARNVPDARLGRAPRELYQRFGQLCVELDPGVWLRPFVAQVDSLRKQGKRVVCTDLRTPREFELARQQGATLWLITRPGAGAPGALAQHPTERGVADFEPSRFHRVLNNTGTLEQLRQELERALSASRPP
jgi:hypothetical protein